MERRHSVGRYILEEPAVIAWDPATKTEHFIRRATFEGKARDFGFLVLTPAEPKLAAVDDSVFDTLLRKTSQQIEYRKRKEVDWTPLFGLFFFPIASRNRSATRADSRACCASGLSDRSG